MSDYILSTLCYLKKEDSLLFLYRNKKKEDPNAGKWVGVGGKMEEGESPTECMLREVYEETGLTVTQYTFHGVVSFISDTWSNELMFLYSADEFTGEIISDCNEGDLKWIPIKDVEDLSLWEGDRIFLKDICNGVKDINLKLTYEKERLISAKRE